MNTLKSALTFSHIICGALVLLIGLIIMIAQPKGNKTHKKLGWVYYLAMCWISLSAIIGMIFFNFHLFLFPIAIFSFHLVYSGFRSIKLKNSTKAAWYDWLVAIGTLLVGVGLLIYGVEIIGTNKGLGILSLVFGFFIGWSGLEDVFLYKNLAKKDKMWWWFHHMRGMLGGFLAAFTAFLVQNGEIIPVIGQSWIIWVVPGVAGGVGISRWTSYYKKKFAVANTN
jgi:uncharacterized membrane protein